MKNTILVFTLLTSAFCFAQEQTAYSGTHQFFAAPQIQLCDEFGVKKSDSPFLATSGIRFNIEYVTKDSNYVIYIYQKLDTEKESGKLTAEATEFNKYYNSTDGERNSTKRKYFLLSSDEYKRCAYKLLKPCGFVVGVATSVIKIRPGIKKTHDDPFPLYFDFGNDFSLGLLFGWKFRNPIPEKKFSFSTLVGFGTVALSADSLNTKGFLTTPTNNQGLYGSLGVLFEYDSFQVGLFTGLDWMTGKTGTFWIYRNRPWVGVSIGYSIFAPKKPNEGLTNN